VTLHYDYLCKPCYEDGNVPRITLTLPGSVHCQGCGRRLGGLSTSVDHHRAIRAGDTVNDYKTGEVLAEIEWNTDVVIERD